MRSRERGVQDGVIEASFKLKAGPVGLRYDVAKKTARAAIPHDVLVCRYFTLYGDKLIDLQPYP